MIKFVNLYGILFYNGYFFDSDLFLKKENQNKIEISSALCTRTLEKYPGQKPSENVDHYLSVFSFSFIVLYIVLSSFSFSHFVEIIVAVLKKYLVR